MTLKIFQVPKNFKDKKTFPNKAKFFKVYLQNLKNFKVFLILFRL